MFSSLEYGKPLYYVFEILFIIVAFSEGDIAWGTILLLLFVFEVGITIFNPEFVDTFLFKVLEVIAALVAISYFLSYMRALGTDILPF